jgi:hypothetical protein
MTSQEAVSLIKSLADNAANWQRNARSGRGFKTAEAKTRKAVVDLFVALTGCRPSQEEVEAAVSEMGMV